MTIRVLLILVFAHGPPLVGRKRVKGYNVKSYANQIDLGSVRLQKRQIESELKVWQKERVPS